MRKERHDTLLTGHHIKRVNDSIELFIAAPKCTQRIDQDILRRQAEIEVILPGANLISLFPTMCQWNEQSSWV